MELKKGYVRTEVGLIPEDWPIKALGDLGKLEMGKGLLKDDISSFGDIPAIPYTSLYTDFSEVIQREKIKWFSKTDRSPFVVNEPCVLFASSSNVSANTGKASALLDGFPVAVGREVISFKTKQNVTYLSYLLSSSLYRKKTLDLAKGITIKHVYPTTFIDYKIALPSSSEQDKIATALSDVDALIAGLEKLIAKKRDLKQAAMQQLLTGQTRLPGFSGEWVKRTLGEIGEISGAGVDKKIRFGEQPVRLLNYMDVYKRTFLKSSDFSHEVSAKPDQIRRCNVKVGDVFFTPTSEVREDIGHSAVALEDMPEVAYSYHVVRLRIFDGWDPTFSAYPFQIKSFLDQARTTCEGSGTRYVITLPKFRALEILYPADKREQTAIASVLFDMDAEIVALETRLAKTRELKQGMMQELLIGKTRLI